MLLHRRCLAILALVMLTADWTSIQKAGAQSDHQAEPNTKEPPICGQLQSLKQIIAHRGASIEFPESTLASIRGAIDSGATAVEVDVRRTKDGQLVLMHDDSVDRTTNGRGKIHDLTFAEIRQLDAGSWFKVGPEQKAPFAGERVPTLEECLKACRGRIDVMLDLKETGDDYLRQVQAAVSAHGEENRIIVGVRSLDQARQMRRSMPQARQIGLINRADDIEAFADAGVEIIRVWKKDPPEYVTRIRRTGKGLHVNLDAEDLKGVPAAMALAPESVACDSPVTLVRHLKAALREADCRTAAPLFSR